MTTSLCPCDGFVHPAAFSNPPGLSAVSYRAGDFLSFRRALLQPLSGEVALPSWRPMPRGDLALQVLEWWAYIADVLAFYGERSLNANLLATAVLDRDVRGLVRILGYRPRPGIGATAYVAALLSGPRTLELPAGFRIQSKPGPGEQPQTFETSEPVALSMPDLVVASPEGELSGADGSLYLEGIVRTIQVGDLLVLAPLDGFNDARLITAQAISHGKDGAGRAYTAIRPDGAPSYPPGQATAFRLLRSRRSMGLWKFSTTHLLVTSPLNLESVDRSIAAGQLIALTAPGVEEVDGPIMLHVTGTHEEMWPTTTTVPPVLLPLTCVSWQALAETDIDLEAWDDNHRSVLAHVDFAPAGRLRDAPRAHYDGTPARLMASAGKSFRIESPTTVLLEDADGDGVRATGSVSDETPTQLELTSFDQPSFLLKTPLRVLHNVFEVTRGKTVEPEQLGVGDASEAHQEFVLQKSPLTYLPAGDSYKSTLSLYVDGIRWSEVESFYGQAANAHVFVTHEDAEQKTHLRGGDGVHGARFPSGSSIVAHYRVESGQKTPAEGALTTIVKPHPGVLSVRAPVRAGGGADPDPAEQIRRYAPRSVLTFGRAISADDYEAIAAAAPSVTRVRAEYAWNADEQRAAVTLYVGDTGAAVSAARDALVRSADPNRPLTVLQATPVEIEWLSIGVRVRPEYVLAEVLGAVTMALSDPETGLFGERRTAIGESVYFSQISATCERVPGVEALTGAELWLSRPDPETLALVVTARRVNVRTSEFLFVRPSSVDVSPEVLSHA